MFDNIKKDYVANREPRNIAGFRVLLVYRFGQWRMTIKPRIIRAPLSYIYKLMEKHVRFKYGIELPYTVEIKESITFEHQHGIVIHGETKIGSGCIIRQGVTIGNSHAKRPLEAPIIGNNVNIGAGAKLLGKINIGNDVVIGANSVVIRDVPSNTTVVGAPARVIAITD